MRITASVFSLETPTIFPGANGKGGNKLAIVKINSK